MAENLFGRVPVGGITPSEFEVSFDPLFKERQADVADRQVAVSEGTLRLNQERLDREKFTQDRTIRLAALEDIAGFDLSKLHGNLAPTFMWKLDKFKKDFDDGILSPEEIQSQAYKLGAEYLAASGYYSEAQDYVQSAIDDESVLVGVNANTTDGFKHIVGKPMPQMISEAGKFWVDGTYDVSDNTAMFNVQTGQGFTRRRMTLDEAMEGVAKGDFNIPTVNPVGPFTTEVIKTDVIGLYDIANSPEHKAYISPKGIGGVFEERNAEESFDNFFRPDGSSITKTMRGAVRRYLERDHGLTLTTEEQAAFDNGNMAAIRNMKAFMGINDDPQSPDYGQPNISKYDELVAIAKEEYVRLSRWENQETPETDEKSDWQIDQDNKAKKLKIAQENFIGQINSTWTKPYSHLEVDDRMGALGYVTVPVPTEDPISVRVGSVGEVLVTGLRVRPDKTVEVSGILDSEFGTPVDYTRLSSGEVSTILHAINLTYQLEKDERVTIDNVLRKAVNLEYETQPGEGQQAAPSAP